MRREYEGLVDYISDNHCVLARQLERCESTVDSYQSPECNGKQAASADLEPVARRLIEIGYRRWRIDDVRAEATATDIWQELSPDARKRLLTLCHPLVSRDTQSSRNISDQGMDYQNSSEFNRAVLDSIAAQLAVIDQNGTILSTNRAWVDFRMALARSGRPMRGLVGENYLNICEEIGREGCEQGFEALDGVRSVLAGVKARFQLQYELDCSDSYGSETRWFMLSVTPFQAGMSGAVVTHVDISAQVQAEVALRLERDRFQHMASVAPGVIHSYVLRDDGSCSFVYSSPSIKEIYGATAEELREHGELAIQAMHPDDAARVEREVALAKESMSLWQSEFRVRHPTKGTIWVEGRSTPILESDGCVVWHGFLTDITARKDAEEALRRSEEHLRLAMGTAPMGTWELELDSYALSWSDNLWTMMGQTPHSDTLSLESYSSAIHPDDRQRVLDELSQAIET
ncbi:MAG: PAS domain-containing protein, partial [Pirellulaceae bacterium]|nr:PAS domain-containing protein [Pirellulaceae bacterium]